MRLSSATKVVKKFLSHTVKCLKANYLMATKDSTGKLFD